MNQEIAKKILETNRKTYEKIGVCFSGTRGFLWKDFEVFKKYVKPSSNVLDLGCGNGRALSLFGKQLSSYTGIDGSLSLIREAQKKFPFAQFNHADILKLSDHKELFEKQYDIVCLFAVLNHFPISKHWETILHTAYTLLKPEGLLFMTNWNLWNITTKKSFWVSWREKLFLESDVWERKYGLKKNVFGFQDIPTLWKSKDLSDQLYYYSFRISQLANMLHRTGFKVCEARYIKNGTHAHWWNGTNNVVVAKK